MQRRACTDNSGTGNNIYFAMDYVNEASGAEIFSLVDLEMRRYLETNRFLKLIQGMACWDGQ